MDKYSCVLIQVLKTITYCIRTLSNLHKAYLIISFGKEVNPKKSFTTLIPDVYI